MKIALYIEDGLEQIVLTPESKTEASILEKVHDGTRTLELRRGSFYACNGGWTRFEPSRMTDGVMFPSERKADDSTMIVMRQPIDTKANHTQEEG